jgi:hypothetical protein
MDEHKNQAQPVKPTHQQTIEEVWTIDPEEEVNVEVYVEWELDPLYMNKVAEPK